MATYFFDSSALVKYYIDETGSDWVEILIDAQPANEILIAEITGAEVVAALTRRSRLGHIAVPDAAIVIGLFKNHFRYKLNSLVVRTNVVEAAMDLAETHGLRGFDSIQLASALTTNETLVTRGHQALIFISADSALNQAAIREGLSVDNPNNHGTGEQR